MPIALHGGFTEEMIFGLSGGFILALIYFIFVHYRIHKSKYYNEEYVYFSSGRKIILYLGFFVVNFCVAYAIFLIFTIILGVISGYFLK
jgi:hypothetical protein